MLYSTGVFDSSPSLDPERYLSIRLALGQVLTNRVFSVFIADEVDASMDDERAEYTAECLRRLTDLISQVILITHKHPEADQMLELT